MDHTHQWLPIGVATALSDIFALWCQDFLGKSISWHMFEDCYECVDFPKQVMLQNKYPLVQQQHQAGVIQLKSLYTCTCMETLMDNIILLKLLIYKLDSAKQHLSLHYMMDYSTSRRRVPNLGQHFIYILIVWSRCTLNRTLTCQSIFVFHPWTS